MKISSWVGCFAFFFFLGKWIYGDPWRDVGDMPWKTTFWIVIIINSEFRCPTVFSMAWSLDKRHCQLKKAILDIQVIGNKNVEEISWICFVDDHFTNISMGDSCNSHNKNDRACILSQWDKVLCHCSPLQDLLGVVHRFWASWRGREGLRQWVVSFFALINIMDIL